ncbi:MAG: Rieske 2Fe-2S domain-containing protein, partial [Dehalococcoidia bacterium]
MKQTSLRWRLSRRAGIGARRVAEQPSGYPAPSRLPVGHPHLGLRDRWYLVCAAGDLRDEAKGVRLLGEDLVLWRNRAGRVSLMRDSCPHRGARLSLGDVVDGDLRCW